MDTILSGILASDTPEGVKKAIFQKICNAASTQQTEDVVVKVLEISASMTLDGNSKLETENGLKIFKIWAKSDQRTFQMFFTTSYIRHLLDGEMTNRPGAIELLKESMILMKGNEKSERLLCIIEAKTIDFLRSYPDLTTLNEFTKFLVEFPNCIPRADFRATFCSAYIRALHNLTMPLSLDEIRPYMFTVERLAKFLKHVWEMSSQDALFSSLQTILGLIATPMEENPNGDTSMSLAAVVQLLPTTMIGSATKAVLNDRLLTDENMKIAMIRMMQWMSWITASRINQWVLAFLKGLAALKRYSVLMEITLSTVEMVYEKLAVQIVRDGALKVLSYMLMSFQHSPEAFHKIAGLIPTTVHTLHEENTPSSRKCVEHLAELAHCQIYLHSGFPDLYDPILEAIKEYKAPTPEVIQSHLNKSKWTAQQLDVITSPSSLSLVKKSETGKTGLVNLGNTCYMNSVLQALYMCDDFRHVVLSSPIYPQTKVMLKLQHTFAHLKLSQRAAYSPTAFLNASRPPWFTQGHQQDCSEYLRYLLVHLHEQEQAAKKENVKQEKMETDQEDQEPTLIEKVFTGKLETTLRCLKCGNHSSRMEDFIDLPLPFPNSNVKSDEQIVNGSSKTEKLAGGDTCHGSNKESDAKSADSDTTNKKESVVCLSEMVDFFLAPEKLHGDNCYHCENCDGLQDAEKTIRITQAPQYLLLCLLRFSYDVKTQSRSKLLRDVNYPKVLYLPVMTDYNPECNGESGAVTKKAVTSHVTYCLNAVIIHAGLSLDCGHYYSYGRRPLPGDVSEANKESNGTDSDDKTAPNSEKWLLFNDSRVSFSSYESFSSVTKRFSHDTVYVLFYKRMDQLECATNSQLDNKADVPIRRDLREAVERDNKAFFEEQERAARLKSRQKRSSNFGASPSFFRYPDDDNGGPPGSCGGGGGFGGLNNDGPRFVF